MIDDVKISEGVEDTKELKVHEPVTSTPTLITTTAPESSEAQIQKVAAKEVRSAEAAIKGGKDFLKHQAELLEEHNEKVKKLADKNKKLYDQYVWTTTQRRKEGRITDINIHANTKPVNVTVYMNNDIRDFELHKEFTFGNFRISEWDEICAILKTKENKVVPDLLRSLSNMHAKLKKVAHSLNLDSSIPLPLQNPLLSKQKKRKAIKLELETYRVGIYYDKALPEGVSFKENMSIEHPEFGLMFMDEFRDLAFQRVSDINKVETNTLFNYKVRAILDKSTANLKFVELIDKMIQEQPEKHILLNKKAKLELMKSSLKNKRLSLLCIIIL
ncbi:hypothetical protein Tco_0044569 [Tanacetum coccineum]